MKITTLRRLGAALLAPAVLAGAVATAPSAQAAPVPPNSYAYAGARWLDDQLTNGFVYNSDPRYGGFNDYGLSLDVFFALDGLGTRAAAADSIIDAFAADPTVYTSSDAFGYSGSLSAGATAKLATAVIAADDDPAAFGGHDLLAELSSTVVTSGEETGRAKDVLGDLVPPNDFPNADYSNTITQSFVVRALSYSSPGVPQSASFQAATDYLLKQQCADGSFRINMFAADGSDEGVADDTDRVCGTGTPGDDTISIDATAFAIQALLVADGSGATGVDDDIADAVTYLKSIQAADGSFADEGIANSNSTGLAATSLKLAGENGAAANAASWIVGLQVTDAVGEDTALGNELGAIAFDPTALAEGKADGITDATRDQWIRATSQAALGVNAQLPATTLGVTAPATFVQGGKSATIAVTGLVEGEKFRASFAGGTPVTGTANASGAGSVQLVTATTTANRTVTVTGSRASRQGTAVVKVLGARTLAPKLKYTSVKKGKSQTVSISGLAAGETVKVYLSSKLIKTATASASGTYSHTFAVGSSAGKKTVRVDGAFSNRTGSKTFTVA